MVLSYIFILIIFILFKHYWLTKQFFSTLKYPCHKYLWCTSQNDFSEGFLSIIWNNLWEKNSLDKIWPFEMIHCQLRYGLLNMIINSYIVLVPAVRSQWFSGEIGLNLLDSDKFQQISKEIGQMAQYVLSTICFCAYLHVCTSFITYRTCGYHKYITKGFFWRVFYHLFGTTYCMRKKSLKKIWLFDTTEISGYQISPDSQC